MKHLGDITKLSGYVVPAVDVVIGGSPCQGLSVAGKQAGLKLWTVYRADSFGKGDAKGRCSKRKNK